MKRLLAIGSLIALFLTADAFAQNEGVWGFMVFDQQGTYITAKWPKEQSFVAGSSSDAFLELEGLRPLHAYFELRDGEFLVRPMFEADVQVNGALIHGDTLFNARDTVTLGNYRLNFALATDPPPQELPPAAQPLGGVPADPISAADRAESARKPEFAKQGYAFCHDDQFGQSGTPGVDFCVIFDQSSDVVCPEARKSCPNWKPYQPREGDGGGAAGKGGKSGAKGKDIGKEGSGGGNPRRSYQRRVVLPIPKEVGIILLVVLGGALIFWFIKSMIGAGWEGEEIDLEVQDLSDAAKNLQALPEARSSVLVKLAERALQRGDAQEAAILLHLAALRHFDDEGLARFHPSKTNGDYIRAIRRVPELRDLFKGIATETERVRFGDGKVDAGRVAHLIEAAHTLLRRSAQQTAENPIPGASLLVLLALLAPGLQACPSGDEEDSLPAFYSHGPTGLAAFPALLRESGLDISIGHQRLVDVDSTVGVVVLRTSAATSKDWPKDLKLDALLARNISVVVIDDRARSSFFVPTGELIDEGVPAAVKLEVTPPAANGICTWRVAALRETYLGPLAPILPKGRRLSWDGKADEAPAVSKPLDLHPLIVYEASQTEATGATVGSSQAAVAFAAAVREGSMPGCLYVFSDRDLFTNASLTRGPNARFVSAFFAAITPMGQKIAVLDRIDRWTAAGSGEGGTDGSDGGDSQPSPQRTMKASNMMPFVLQSLATLVLLFVLLGAAFGPLRDRMKREHKAFVEHVEALGRQYARTGQAGLTHASHSLARLLVMRNRDRVRGGTSGGWAALARHLAETHGLAEQDVKAALRLGIDGINELGTPRIDDASPASEKMLKTLSRLLGVKSKEATEKPSRRRFRLGRNR